MMDDESEANEPLPVIIMNSVSEIWGSLVILKIWISTKKF
jgi:hypothetical protein